MKQVTPWALALLLMLLYPMPAWSFADTGDLDAVELAAVEALSDMNIIEGYPDGTFRPDELLTRAEFAKMLCIFAAQDKLIQAKNTFTDVSPDEWYAGWIERAAQQGWVSGYPGGEYRPEEHISQEELATVLLRFTKRDTGGLAWPDQYVLAAGDAGILEGLAFSGKAKASRLVTCRMFYNLLPGQSASIIAGNLYVGAIAY